MKRSRFLPLRLSLLAIAALAILIALFGIRRTSAEGGDLASQILQLNNKGVALLDQYKFKEAIPQFEKLVELDSGVVPGQVNLAIAYFYDQKYTKAQETARRVLEADPKEIHALFVLGLIYRNEDEVKQAIDAFTSVHEQDPRDPSTNYYLGRLFMQERDYSKAADYFRQVIEAEPYNASAHYNLAMALNRSGDREGNRAEMKEFQRLQRLFGSTTVGLQYLEQGRYAIAIDRIPPRFLPGGRNPNEAAPIKVTFAEVAGESGLRFRHGGPGKVPAAVSTLSEFEDTLVPAVGSGVSFADYDQDGHMDIFLANAGPQGARGALFHNDGKGHFEDRTDAAGITYSGRTMAAVWGDYDNDGYPDLYLVNYGANVLYHNLKDGRFADVTKETGTGDPAWGMGGGFVDFDHDGDLDIFVANFAAPPTSFSTPVRFPNDLTGAPNVLYRNNGNATFTEVGEASHLAGGALRTAGFIPCDFDNSRDVDFLLINFGAPNQLFNNLRDGTFKLISGTALADSSRGLSAGIGDLNQDGFTDVGLPAQEGGTSKYLLNQGHDQFEADPALTGLASRPGLSTQFFDYDNDGDLDVLLLSTPLVTEGQGLSGGRDLYLFENREGKFIDVSAETGLDRYRGLPMRGLSIADYDLDGDLDFAVNVNGRAPLLFRNDGGNQNNWIEVRLVGNSSNRYGLGVKAEAKAGGLWQRHETVGAQGFLSQNPPLLHFGLGKHQQVDAIRLLWPNGILQSEIDRPANQLVEIQELDRKGTSCPILYVWNGKTYQFQTDFLGGSAYGSLLAPGIYELPDTNEYIKLNRSDVALKNGRVSITMNNQLEETILFDQLRLVTVDHPSGYDVFPDEKLLPGPPYQSFKIFTVSRPHLPVAAHDGHGRDVLRTIEKVDRTYPEVPDTLPFKGYTDRHDLILDLGDVSNDYTVLLMNAWIDYADSSSNLAASQAGVELVSPYLQVQDENGHWVTVIEHMGFPAGLPKTMTVDLSGKFLSSSRLVRIVTNMKIYWDQILVESGNPRTDYRIHRLAAESADLHYRGFPKPFSPDGRNPKAYLYDQLVPMEWKVHVGAYTHFGNVLPLLKDRDDMFVITRSGDEIAASFDLRDLPVLPKGWVRDYLVYVDGFGKDMDPNSAAPDFVGPLPFHGMSSFPYPDDEHYPDSTAYRQYQRTWNTRIVERSVPDLETRRADD
ncbi:MAG: FG-GAP-like repeat-containing protein [Acidobacteriota bacterium]